MEFLAARLVLFISAHKKIFLYGAGILVLLVLIFSARNCYLDYKTAQTKRALDELKIKEIRIEDEILFSNSSETEKKVEIAEKKIDAANETLQKIEKINDIERDEAIRLMCEYEAAQGRKNPLCK